MSILLKKIRIVSIFTLLLIKIILTRSSLGFYFGSSGIMDKFNHIILLLFAIITFFCILTNKYSLRSILFFIGTGILVGFNYLMTGSQTFIFIFMLMIVFKDLHFRKVISLYLWANVVALVVIVGLNIVGLLPSVQIIAGAGTLKSSLGFIHPNTTGITVLVINVGIVSVWGNRLKLKHLIPIWLFNGLIIYFAGARTSLYLLFLTYILWIFIIKVEKSDNLIFRKLLLYTYSTTLVVCFVLSYYFSVSKKLQLVDSLLFKLNQLTSDRLQLGATFINQYGTSLFGKRIDYMSVETLWSKNYQDYAILDNSYLNLIIGSGLILSFFYLVYNIVIMRQFLINKNYWIFIPMMVFALLGLTEQSMLYFWVNFPLAFINILFMDDNLESSG